LSTNTFAGLKLGTKCSGIIIAVFFEIFLAVFSALFLTTKLPKPLTYTFSPPTIAFFTTLKNASTVSWTSTFSIPVLLAISAIISAFVIDLFSFKIYYVVQRFGVAKVLLLVEFVK